MSISIEHDHLDRVKISIAVNGGDLIRLGIQNGRTEYLCQYHIVGLKKTVLSTDLRVCYLATNVYSLFLESSNFANVRNS